MSLKRFCEKRFYAIIFIIMEDLNKNQIVLLTLLVSFVTSIATGIITVSLLQEAPIEVTRNINSIVQKTIETVTIPGVSAPAQKEVTTVVVKEEDLVIDSINKNLKSIVRIKNKEVETGTTFFYGIGTVVSKDGLIGADRKTINLQNTYTAVMSDGTEFILTPLGVSKDTNFILFKANVSDKDKTSTSTPAKAPYVFVPAVFGGEAPKLGQTVIGLGGDLKNSVAVGRVISLDMRDSGTGTSTVSYLSQINTDISTKDLVNGSPVFNLSGDLVGVRLTSDTAGSFTPISILKKELPTLTEATKTP